MGWISDRHMKSGRSLYNGGPKRKGPLRKIVRTIRASTGLFDHDFVELECGHEGRSYGGVRAICTKCPKKSTPKEA